MRVYSGRAAWTVMSPQETGTFTGFADISSPGLHRWVDVTVDGLCPERVEAKKALKKCTRHVGTIASPN